MILLTTKVVSVDKIISLIKVLKNVDPVFSLTSILSSQKMVYHVSVLQVTFEIVLVKINVKLVNFLI